MMPTTALVLERECLQANLSFDHMSSKTLDSLPVLQNLDHALHTITSSTLHSSVPLTVCAACHMYHHKENSVRTVWEICSKQISSSKTSNSRVHLLICSLINAANFFVVPLRFVCCAKSVTSVFRIVVLMRVPMAKQL
jgi:hypothetical protein